MVKPVKVGTLIRADGTVETFVPSKGGRFSLEEVQKLVGVMSNGSGFLNLGDQSFWSTRMEFQNNFPSIAMQANWRPR